MAFVEVKHLKRYFGQVKAVDDITFTVEEGAIWGFLGPNGAGKTTTISCLIGLLKPTEGDILIDGSPVWNNGALINEMVGYIPADPYFYPQWSVQEHLSYSQSMKGDAPLLSELIEAFQLNVKARVNDLSTGNKQKLSIIMAMMHNPRLLVMDEPTRGLDPLLQQVFHTYVKKLEKNGSTIVMSSHNLSEVENLCEQVALIKNGKIVENGDISSMRAKSVYIISLQTVAPKGDVKEFIKKIDAHMTADFGKKVEIRATGNIADILKKLNKLPLEDVTITKASLEEIFLEYYR